MGGNQNRGLHGYLPVWVASALFALATTVAAQGPGQPLDNTSAGSDAPVNLEDESPVLFRGGIRANLPGEKGLVPYAGKEGGNRHVVQVSRRAAEKAAAMKGALAVELPSGQQFNIEFARTERAPNGDWTFVGKVETKVGPQSAVLTFGPAGMFGVLPSPDGTQLQLSTTHGVTVLEPMRAMHPAVPKGGQAPVDYVVPRQDTGGVVPLKTSEDVALPDAHDRFVTADDVPVRGADVWVPFLAASQQTSEVRVDVLGLYTKNMAELRGSVAAAETECNNYLAVANQAHRDSKTGVKLNYVGLRQVDYPSNAFNLQALNDLTDNRLPDGTDVHALRNALRADLVALLRPYVNGDTNGGIAWAAGAGLRGNAGAHEAWGFSVSNLNQYTLAHEIGHNLGSAHDIVTATTNGAIAYGAYPFSFGYRQDGPPKFATIMAYTTNGQPRVGYFSHPGTTACLNVACGTKQTDNALSLGLMAPTVAEYRLPPDLILVNATSAIEGDPGSLWPRTATVTVKLSTPARSGGVRFDIRTQDGTAVAGADYQAFSQVGAVINEGESSRDFTVTILPDARVEGDEEFRVVLSNVVGAGVHRNSTAVGILDDDPRVVVSGRFLAPEGYSMPTQRFQIWVQEQSIGGAQQASYWVNPPSFEYRVPVQAGSSVVIAPFLGAPFSEAVHDLGVVVGNTTRNIVLTRSVSLTGSLRFASGQAVPESPIDVIAWGIYGRAMQGWGKRAVANPPDYKFSFNVPLGAEVLLDTSPPSPFVRQQVALGELRADRVQNILVGLVPSLVMQGARVAEGAHGHNQTLELSILLSTPAHTGGVEVDVEVVAGSATAGSDFVQQPKTRVKVEPGETRLSFPIVIKGDSIPELTESFKVVLSNASGAWLPSPTATVYIENDDFSKSRNDFNGDGKSDVFWRNLTDGRNIVWSSANSSTQFNPGQVSNQAWSVVGAGDFDGDGKSDVFWRNTRTGQNIIWPSGTSAGSRYVTTVSNLSWRVAAVADFNGDGRADVFWRNGSTGQNTIWWSGQSSGSTAALTVPAVWTVAGTGDFNSDGEQDIVWRNTSTGANILWWSGRHVGFSALTGVSDQAWEVVAIGDFAGDGLADVFWRNRRTGENMIWRDGKYSSRVREQTVSTSWKIVASGDYNGDGRADLFWRNTATGANMVWDSGRYATRRNLTSVTSSAWAVRL